VRGWVETFSGWSGVATATETPEGPAFAVATIAGTPPAELAEHAVDD
jgi:hypothetical protein